MRVFLLCEPRVASPPLFYSKKVASAGERLKAAASLFAPLFRALYCGRDEEHRDADGE